MYSAKLETHVWLTLDALPFSSLAKVSFKVGPAYYRPTSDSTGLKLVVLTFAEQLKCCIDQTSIGGRLDVGAFI